jgi:hypothetical protein
MSERDLRQHSAAAERNKQAIVDVLLRVLPARGRALEIASGTGQHAAHFAAALPLWTWQPTDQEASLFGSIAAWAAHAGVSNVQPPRVLDVTAAVWDGIPTVDAIFCANMIHIAPWAACIGLMQGAGRHLGANGLLITYGPYFVDDAAPAPSNVAFDADLRARDPRWGVRRLNDVRAAAQAAGLTLSERVAMPANNLTLVWRRQ